GAGLKPGPTVVDARLYRPSLLAGRGRPSLTVVGVGSYPPPRRAITASGRVNAPSGPGANSIAVATASTGSGPYRCGNGPAGSAPPPPTGASQRSGAVSWAGFTTSSTRSSRPA